MGKIEFIRGRSIEGAIGTVEVETAYPVELPAQAVAILEAYLYKEAGLLDDPDPEDDEDLDTYVEPFDQDAQNVILLIGKLREELPNGQGVIGFRNPLKRPEKQTGVLLTEDDMDIINTALLRVVSNSQRPETFGESHVVLLDQYPWDEDISEFERRMTYRNNTIGLLKLVNKAFVDAGGPRPKEYVDFVSTPRLIAVM